LLIGLPPLFSVVHLPVVLVPPLFLAAEAGLVVFAARPATRQSGNLSAALGFEAPRWRDSGLIAVWFVISTVASRLIPALVVTVIPALRDHSASNVHLPVHVNGAVAVLAVVQTVVIAPPVEELLFRGLVLRAAMRRFRFVPAALGSSLIFGIFHASQGASWQGAIILAAGTATFGFVQCLLVRRTGRLGPAIAVHSLNNVAAIGFAVALS
jgi:membrane protease YdiL (CAAX protease family)